MLSMRRIWYGSWYWWLDGFNSLCDTPSNGVCRLEILISLSAQIGLFYNIPPGIGYGASKTRRIVTEQKSTGLILSCLLILFILQVLFCGFGARAYACGILSRCCLLPSR